MIDLNDFVTSVDLPAAVGRRLKVKSQTANRDKKTTFEQSQFVTKGLSSSDRRRRKSMIFPTNPNLTGGDSPLQWFL